MKKLQEYSGKGRESYFGNPDMIIGAVFVYPLRNNYQVLIIVGLLENELKNHPKGQDGTAVL